MKPRLLILCTGNTTRSQMAEAFFRHYLGERFEIVSAGLEPKEIHPLTRHVMAEIGFDLAGQYSKDVRNFLGQHFGYIITVCANAEERCPIFPGVSVRVHWPFDDPVKFAGTETERVAKFRAVRDEIRATIAAWLTEQGLWREPAAA